ncbi:hypothetical protein [Brevundimonas aurifodinae]|uniref:Flagellar hook-length control protein FliK n=2 Tax=Brevundimonas TaxID=41275 RepID=A0ABV1NIF8_9CAUL|nr:MAG: hypothetical protein B7Z42_01710 [Brevundimonas sp. 12-68-7]OYX35728.1 MAG: hypothetical protein B7Z01_02230 [Brevundimonas subvibrioides]
MSAIRPDLPPSLPAATPAASQVRAAQAAFFRAALNEVGAAPAAPRSAPTTEPEPARAQRPGALLDIRV